MSERECVKISGGNEPAQSEFELPGLRGRLFARPAGGGRGGDLHVLSTCLHARVSRLVVADAAGHGLLAAEASGEILGALRALHHVVDNAEILAALDHLLPGEGLATATSATLDADTGELFYGYAGPPMAFHFARAVSRWSHLQAVCSLESHERFIGLPLGVLPGSAYCQSHVHLDPGDLLVLFSDGLIEQHGMDELLDVCRAVAEPTPATVEEALLATAEDSGDDVTLVVAERV